MGYIIEVDKESPRCPKCRYILPHHHERCDEDSAPCERCGELRFWAFRYGPAGCVDCQER